jgi:methionyl-tRNA formyltransferase
MSGEFLLDTIDLIGKGDFTPRRQDDGLATPAPKITPEDALIDFGFPAENVKNFVRGLSTRPGAYTFFRGKKVKILKCKPVLFEVDPGGRPGTVLPDRKHLLVRCADSAVEIESLVPEGRKRMDGVSFLNGFRVQPGEIFGERTTIPEERH